MAATSSSSTPISKGTKRSGGCRFRCRFHASYVSEDGDTLYCHAHRHITNCSKLNMPEIQRYCQFVCSEPPKSGEDMCSKHFKQRETPKKQKTSKSKSKSEEFDMFDMGSVRVVVKCRKCKTETMDNSETQDWLCDKCK